MKHFSHYTLFFGDRLLGASLIEILAEAYINLQNVSVKATFHFSSKIILKLQLHFVFAYSIDIFSLQEAHRITNVECGLATMGQSYTNFSINSCSPQVHEKLLSLHPQRAALCKGNLDLQIALPMSSGASRPT